MEPRDVDRLWMGFAAAMIALFVLLGASNLLDLDDTKQRSPLPTVAPSVYQHPEVP